MFTDKEKVSLLIRGLAMHYTDRLAFAYVDPSVVELLDEFQVTDAPAVRLRKVSGDVVVYEGAVNAVDMQAWLSKYAPERIVDEVNRYAAFQDLGYLSLTYRDMFRGEDPKNNYLLG